MHNLAIIEELPGIYRIPVPLPKNPLKELNAYFVRGSSDGSAGDIGRNLLIDTGFNRPESEDALRAALEHLGADMSRTDIFITHAHSDHCGLMNKFALPETQVWCSRADGEIIKASLDSDYWEALDDLYASHGFPVKKRKDVEKHPGWEFNVKGEVSYTAAEEGLIIEAGEYTLRTVWTPGHTPGHMCLYDEKHKLLFSADHVLSTITPNIAVEPGMEDPLRLYLGSLDKVAELDVKKTLTGHRAPPADFAARVKELKEHHVERLKECIEILRECRRPMNAYEVAAYMKWDIKYDSWDAFPAYQKWFATGEAVSHLQYLYTSGRIGRFESSGIISYSLSSS